MAVNGLPPKRRPISKPWRRSWSGRPGATKDDPTSQFALLKMAMEIAMQLGDGETAYQAIDAMADTSKLMLSR